MYRGTWLCCPVAVKKWFKSTASDAQQREIRGEIMTNAVGISACENCIPCLASKSRPSTHQDYGAI